MPPMSRSHLPRSLCVLLITAPALLAGCTDPGSADYYARLEAQLLAKHKLRTETAPAEYPYDAGDLARDFERIALHHEGDVRHQDRKENWSGNRLKRWQGPLTYTFFGNAVTPADRAEVARLMQRLAAATGLQIAESDTDWNFLILITTPEERDEYSAVLRHMDPGLAATFDLWRHSPNVICVANDPFSNEDGRRLSVGMVAIGSEVGGVLRPACLHEEIAQSLGLANDHPEVRPSIFNDDGEFALLTDHDADLLRILYDPRLTPGMTAGEAMPIVRRIAGELAPGEPSSRRADAGAAGARPLTQDAPRR